LVRYSPTSALANRRPTFKNGISLFQVPFISYLNSVHVPNASYAYHLTGTFYIAYSMYITYPPADAVFSAAGAAGLLGGMTPLGRCGRGRAAGWERASWRARVRAVGE
jgi:hypothetical protein